MLPQRLQLELKRYGPDGSAPPPSRGEAQNYCRELAQSHYENFTVASWLLPRGVRQHFCNLYAYCRWADDLADELPSPAESLALLDWWQSELLALYASPSPAPRHPVFIALKETIRQFDIPRQPFLDLLAAFRQDQAKFRYQTWEELHDYCRHSANPVGRLVLHLARTADEEAVQQSDSICTGLQLANFCQDVARDFDRGRIYLPQADCRRFQFEEPQFAQRQATDAFRSLLAEQVQKAEVLLRGGQTLPRLLPREFRLPVGLFARGGVAILAAIRRQRYDVWTRRPVVGKWRKLWLVMQGVFGG